MKRRIKTQLIASGRRFAKILWFIIYAHMHFHKLLFYFSFFLQVARLLLLENIQMERTLKQIADLQPEVIDNIELREFNQEQKDRIEALEERIANLYITFKQNRDTVDVLEKQNATLQKQIIDARKELSELTVFVMFCFVLVKNEKIHNKKIKH